MRKALEAKIRNAARQIQADPSVSDELKEDAGLPIHSSSRTPVPVPTTAPIAKINANNVQQHVIRFTEATSSHANVRPTGVAGIQIWGVPSDTPPVDYSTYTMLDATTRMSATIDFSGEDAGKTCWYRFRYVNTRQKVGPWSMVYNATILK